MSLLPDAVVFDCDGTIADTESLSDQAWQEILAGHGYQPTAADFAAVIGHPFVQNWSYFSARVELGDQQVFRSRLRSRFVELFETELRFHDDAVDTLRALAGAGVPVAVASSSSRAHVLRVLERGDLEGCVRAVVGADDVTRHKPDPEPYLAAVGHLGVPAGRCSAVEDTPVGVASATAAGLYTVAVVRSHGDRARLAEAHRVVERVTVAVLVPDVRGEDL